MPVAALIRSRGRTKRCSKCQKEWTDPSLRGIPISLSYRIVEFWEIMYWDRKILRLSMSDAYKASKKLNALTLQERS